MINLHSKVVSALNTVLPTHYEMALTSKTKTPCISYQERDNADTDTGDTIGYSRVSYTVKVWHTDIAIIQENVLKVDKVMRALGFKRVSANELHDNNSAMIQKILTYECLTLENY